MMSIKDIMKMSKNANPHPGKFPDYIVDNNGIWGWFLVEPTRGKVKNHLEFQIGSWFYSMCLLR